MPIELRFYAACTILSALAGCGSAIGSFEPDELPDELEASYALFEQRCSKCHSIARPLTARIDDIEHWERYVTRMRRMPGSGINREDGDIILRFLTYYTLEVRGLAEPVEDEEAALDAEFEEEGGELDAPSE